MQSLKRLVVLLVYCPQNTVVNGSRSPMVRCCQISVRLRLRTAGGNGNGHGDSASRSFSLVIRDLHVVIRAMRLVPHLLFSYLCYAY